jgi:transmembrane sensor
MKNDTEYYNELTARYLSGEASEEEIGLLSAWTQASDENALHFKQSANAWSILEKNRIDRQIDTEAEWKIFSEKTKVKTTSIRKLRIYFAAAAVILLLAVSSVIFFMTGGESEAVIFAASGFNREARLPDGSMITLTPGSSLSYEKDFENEQRRVILKGEAYFEVEHNPGRPFMVEAGEVRVEVTGTSFYVNMNVDSGTRVILTTGSVRVSHVSKPDAAITLKPGEQTLVPASGVPEPPSVSSDENYMAWKTGKIVFDDCALHDALPVLEKVYRKRFILDNPALGNCRITVTFSRQPLASVLNVLEATLDIVTKENQQTVQISGKGCTD